MEEKPMPVSSLGSMYSGCPTESQNIQVRGGLFLDSPRFVYLQVPDYDYTVPEDTINLKLQSMIMGLLRFVGEACPYMQEAFHRGFDF